MSLNVQDFVARSEGISIEDVPTDVRDRLNDALGDLTGGEGGPTGSPAEIPDFDLFVSAERGSSSGGPYQTISGALDDAEPGDIILVEDGTYGADTYGDQAGLQIGSQDAGTDPASAPLRDVTVVGQNQPTINGWVQILDPGVTFEGFEVTGEVFSYGLAAFEPEVTIRDVTISGVTNGLFVPSASNVLVKDCVVENYSFYGAIVSGRNGLGGVAHGVAEVGLGVEGDDLALFVTGLVAVVPRLGAVLVVVLLFEVFPGVLPLDHRRRLRVDILGERFVDPLRDAGSVLESVRDGLGVEPEIRGPVEGTAVV